MSFEGELKSRYSEVINRLRPPPAPVPKFVPRIVVVPIPEPVAELSTQITTEIFTQRITLRSLLRWLAVQEDITVERLQGPQRKASAVVPRHIYYHLAYHSGRFTTTQIAKVIQRDHSTVVTGIQRLVLKRKEDPELDARIAGYEAYIDEVNRAVDNGDRLPLCRQRALSKV